MKKILIFILVISFLNGITLNRQITHITNVTNTGATINIGKLKVGESGIVVHVFDDKNSIILTQAIVTKTDKNTRL